MNDIRSAVLLCVTLLFVPAGLAGQGDAPAAETKEQKATAAKANLNAAPIYRKAFKLLPEFSKAQRYFVANALHCDLNDEAKAVIDKAKPALKALHKAAKAAGASKPVLDPEPELDSLAEDAGL